MLKNGKNRGKNAEIGFSGSNYILRVELYTFTSFLPAWDTLVALTPKLDHVWTFEQEWLD